MAGCLARLAGIAVAGAMVAAAAVAGAAPAHAYRAPRTADGRPDLQGLWSAASLTNLQRPKDFTTLVASPQAAAQFEKKAFDEYREGLTPTDPRAPALAPGKVKDESAQWSSRPIGLARVGGQIRTSFIVDPPDGRLPLTPAARAAAEKALKDEDVSDDPEGRPFDERCLLGGGGGVAAPIMTGMLVGVVQTRDHVVLLGESNHDARIVRLADRRHPPAAVNAWMGDSVGWWEGETLVVETTNLSPADRWRWNEGDWIPLTPRARFVERFTRTGPATLLYSFTVDDPGAYTRPWRGEASLRAETGLMPEYACHEGNYALANILAGARHEDATTPAAPAK
jgi:hypothetical protein